MTIFASAAAQDDQKNATPEDRPATPQMLAQQNLLPTGL
jgi:hypothetical protein